MCKMTKTKRLLGTYYLSSSQKFYLSVKLSLVTIYSSIDENSKSP